jgi:hypothetical protein
LCFLATSMIELLRISAIVDARFVLIADAGSV